MGVSDCSTMTLHNQILLLFFLTPGVLCLESSCTSGPGYPPLDQCKETPAVNTLLLCGITETEGYSTSMEVITSTGVCTPKLPPIPVARHYASAVLIHNKLLYCGGVVSTSPVVDPYHGSWICHSYDIGEGDTVWREEPQMVRRRSSFSLSLVGDTVYAVGGWGDGMYEDTVESYTEEGGWTLEGEMIMDKWRIGHCSVV